MQTQPMVNSCYHLADINSRPVNRFRGLVGTLSESIGLGVICCCGFELDTD